jgi:maltose alpha-D-glucosyltransferase/alpha-amylase
LAVNVAAQRRDPDSLLNWFERLIRRRRETPELGFGRWSIVENDARAVLAHRCDWDGTTVVAIHNFSAEPCRVRLELDGLDDVVAFHDVLAGGREDLAGPAIDLTLGGYGYRWLRLQRKDQRLVP